MKLRNVIGALAIYHMTVACAVAGVLVSDAKVKFLEPEAGAPGHYSFLYDDDGNQTLMTGTPAAPGELPTIFSLHDTEGGGYLGEAFSAAKLTYTNGVNRGGSFIETVPIQLDLSLLSWPYFCGVGLEEQVAVKFDLSLTATPNFGDDPAIDADVLALGGETSALFSLFGKNFKVEILGFGTSSCSISPEFIVPERDTAVMDLYVRVTCVPEPSTFALAGMGGVGLVGLARRHRRRLLAS